MRIVASLLLLALSLPAAAQEMVEVPTPAVPPASQPIIVTPPATLVATPPITLVPAGPQIVPQAPSAGPCMVAPARVAPPTGYVLVPPKGEHWTLELDCHGGLEMTRHHHGNPGLWGSGLALWIGSWLVGATIANVSAGNPMLWAPVIGSFVSAGVLNSGPSGTAAYTADGLLQLGGIAMFIVGLAVGDKVEHAPVQLVPLAVSSGLARNGVVDQGGGLALRGTF